MIIPTALRGFSMLRAASMFVGGSKFFEPKVKFLDWMKAQFLGRLIYDIGAGQGHVTEALREHGLTVTPLDSSDHMNRTIHVLRMDAMAFAYAPGSVAMFCRPSHGGFVETSILQAVECGVGTILYVGLTKNADDDLGRFRRRFKLVSRKVGNQDENVWRWDRAA